MNKARIVGRRFIVKANWLRGDFWINKGISLISSWTVKVSVPERVGVRIFPGWLGIPCTLAMARCSRETMELPLKTLRQKSLGVWINNIFIPSLKGWCKQETSWCMSSDKGFWTTLRLWLLTAASCSGAQLLSRVNMTPAPSFAQAPLFRVILVQHCYSFLCLWG